MCIYAHAYVYVYMHTYIYIYIHTHTHIYIIYNEMVAKYLLNKNMFFNNFFKKIAHYIYNGFEEDIYIYIY